MGEHVINRNSKCRERSGQGPGHRKMYKMWAPCGKVILQAREWLRRLREPCRSHPGLGWFLQDEALGNPLVYSNFGFQFFEIPFLI